MPACFELDRNAKGEFHFRLVAPNGEPILSSETYATRGGAEKGIASVRKNAPDPARYERRESEDHRYYFVLKAANHLVIGTSQLYASEASRDRGIEAVRNHGTATQVRDLTAAS